MIPFPHYTIEEKLYESEKTLVYRVSGGDIEGNKILKLLKKEYPAPWEITEMIHEYHILNDIKAKGVIEIRKLERLNQHIGIVIEDIGGVSLDRLIPEQGMDVIDFIPLAIKMATVISYLHHTGYIHKDINPSNFVINQKTGELKIIDFGIASPFLKEHPDILNANMLEGTIHYLSPEQTGRMNRMVDYRSDYYSLGISFYEILTGQLPYAGVDPMEIAYQHLSSEPDVESLYQNKIPSVVRDIILKLMKLNPVERYQSLNGLLEDLEHLQGKKRIRSFVIAKNDVSDQFNPTGEIVGRGREIEVLKSAFTRVVNGEKEWVSVHGMDGSGRSSLINAIHDTILGNRAYFIPVKFDRMKKDIPYYSLTLAFQKMVRQILLEKNYKIQKWKEIFENRLGENAAIICDLMPGLELILEEVRDIPPLPTEQSSYRFNRFFAAFISAFTDMNQPLVLFLDDIQWMDSPTYQVLECLLMSIETNKLMIVSTFQDSEAESKIATNWLDKLIQWDVNMSEIELKPLQFEDVRQVIISTFHQTNLRVRELSHLLYDRSIGNPLLLVHQLQYLYDHRHVRFEQDLAKWVWDIKEIRDQDLPSTSEDLMKIRFSSMSESEQKILKLSACIGYEFDLKTLATVSEKPVSELIPLIRSAIESGFISPLEGAYRLVEEMKEHQARFRFSHDCVYRAVYNQLSREEQETLHLKIGHLILKTSRAMEWDESIFYIVHHLSIGKKQIIGMNSRFDLADLNLIAGRKARVSGAYQAAYQYLMEGIELIKSCEEVNPWDIHYELTLSLYSESVEAAFLSGNYSRMKQLIAEVSHRADNYLDEIPLYLIRIQGDIRRGEYQKASRYARYILNQLGLTIDKRIGRFKISRLKAKVNRMIRMNRSTEPDDLPDMRDSFKKMEMWVMDVSHIALIETVKNVEPYIVFLKVLYSLEYGNCAESVFGYLDYARYIGSELNDFNKAYQFGKYALNLVEKKQYYHIKSKVLFQLCHYIRHWKKPLIEVLPQLKEAEKVGLNNGDPQSGFESAYIRILYAFFMGKSLVDLLKEIEDILRQMRIYHYPIITAKLDNLKKLFHNLSITFSLSHQLESTKAEGFEPSFTSQPDLLFDDAVLNLMKAVILEDKQPALGHIGVASNYIHEVTGSYGYIIFYAYRALYHLSVFYDYNSRQKKRTKKKIDKDHQRIRQWCELAPSNIKHLETLISAEVARINGEDWKAMELFDQAIKNCEINGFLIETAMSYEWTARFYIEHSKEKIAAVYLQDAYRCYREWGAETKLRQMRDKYDSLLKY